ncbi:glutamate receptor 2.5 [Artemisia annua]|uniref:Glutamate receptor 2.5 n=1 Tax=Artemisia annua TaxID=35608 RepID=A0A2U1PKI5_ARTAN|nr:glutamate receptor 2.5 [Artemisia annua]
MYIGSKLVASVTDMARVPIFSFAGRSTVEYPYFFQIKEDEMAMAKSVPALIESFKWRDVIYVYEDSDDLGPDILQYLFESFQDKNIRITYKSVIAASATNDQVIQELHNLMKIHTSVFIVNMSPILASCLFVNAKMLGMMSKEYAWILTQKTTEIMHSPEFEVIESLQGALGVVGPKVCIPMLAIWAYDTTWALAESVEKVGVSKNGSMLLGEIMEIKFKGVSGEFRLNEKKLVSNGFEIINVIDHGERKVGYWTLSKGIRRAHTPFKDTVLQSSNRVEDVIWPGGSITTPRGWILRMNLGKTLRIGLITEVRFKNFLDAAENNVTNPTGFSYDVFQACIHALQYDVPIEFIPITYERYDDLIMKVYNKVRKIDGLLGDTTILANRSDYVDFTTTYTDVGIGTLTKIKEQDSMIFLLPLGVDVWLTFLLFGVLTGFTIWAIEAMDEKSERDPSQGIGKIFWLILLTIFFAQRDKLSKNLSRFVMFVWLIVVLVIFTSYTATSTSLLTVEQFELATKGGIVGFHGGSFVEGVTINNVKLIDNTNKDYYSYEDYANALSKGGNHGGADAILDEVPYIRMFLGMHSDDYAMVLSESCTSGFGFVFAKGSPLVREMSREIARMRENGALRSLEKKWFKSELSLSSQDSFRTPKSHKLDRFRGLFIAIGVSLVFALTVSAFYAVHARIQVENIISLLAGKNLMVTIRNLLFRNFIRT